MKGIILAGGTGSRLLPSTQVVSKQLMPVYDKPLIYYPLTTLMLANIRDILIISTPMETPRFRELFGDGSNLGINLQYAEQAAPDGIPQAFTIGKEFIGNSKCALILGDNIFYGQNLSAILQEASKQDEGATVFAYSVSQPERYGVLEIDQQGKVSNILEKPENPSSNFAVTGLYFYDNTVLDIIQDIKPSARGELEITDVNKVYLQNNMLQAKLLGRGMAWLDAGTHDSLLEAATYIQTIERRTALKIGCPEEVAWRKSWINDEQLLNLAKPLIGSGYGKYLKALLEHQHLGNSL